ncbi:MAG: hypothetical protein JF599_01840 [Verrucomicrobia bacterium]|nr:hypothetical protein [Verrucomicrobiota bacterium]
MSDSINNGADWDRMLEQLVDLEVPLGAALGSGESWWRPDISMQSREEASRAWCRLHEQYQEAIHAAVRELVRTGGLLAPRPEILYFLSFRLDAAIRYLSMAVTIKDDKAVSIIPFPAIEMSAYTEWLLTDWADQHATLEMISLGDRMGSFSGYGDVPVEGTA